MSAAFRAGTEVAEAVGRKVADTLAPLIPDKAAPETELSVPTSTKTPSDEAKLSPREDRGALRDDVREVLEVHAVTGDERAALSPAFVEMVTTGVQFLLSVERQFPDAIDALQVRD